MEHVSHYIHMMSLHTHNDALMCKVFPLSLGPTVLRWFNGLRKGSIHSFAALIPGAWSSICDVQPGAITGGRITIHKDEGWQDPSELCQSVLGAIQ